MHIVECYLECGGFDYQFIKGGISVYTWNLGRALTALGHRVSVITAAHGRLADLRARYPIEELPYRREYRMPLVLDPRVWREHSPRQEVPLVTRAYRLRHEGIDLYFLCNEMLDRYSDTFYPPYESKGRDLGFFKPLVFQVDMVMFLREWLGAEPLTIHAHEPFYQYLVPLALARDPTKRVVSTVQSNMPVNKQVYRPELEAVLELLEVPLELAALDDLRDPPARDDLGRCLTHYLPETHLHYSYPEDYVALYSLILEHSDAVDFLSPGHLELYSQFEGTAFRAMYQRLRVSELVRRHADKLFVGWCAIGERWHAADFSRADRGAVLRELGLAPELPTFLHNARYAVHHKGQNELVRAAREVLSAGARCNFVLRCLAGAGIPDPAYHALAADFPDRVHLEWHNRPEAELIALCAAADFCVFPSKFEMDTFLIAQGEAMLAGCVPIASAQLGMRHWGHAEGPGVGPEDATGLSVIRSFRADDPELVRSLVSALHEALALHARGAPYAARAARARQLAQGFTWERSARAHLEVMERLWAAPRRLARPPAAAPPGARTSWRDVALREGELMSWRRAAPAAPALPSLAVATSPRGTAIEYGLGAATGVEVFFAPPADAGDAAPAPLARQPLVPAPARAAWAGQLPAAAAAGPLILLVTLADGSQFWDGVPRATGGD
jgi:hypothetical protein